MKKLFSLILACIFILSFTACDDDDDDQNLLQIAQSRSELSSLVIVIGFIDENSQAAQTAQLSEVLSGPLLSYTTFLPNNEAFVELDQNQDGVFDQVDIDLLAGVSGAEILADSLYALITNHIASTTITSDELTDGFEVQTIASIGDSGSNFGLTINNDGSSIVVVPSFSSSSGTVVTADISASNGVAHVVDKVLLDELSATALGIDIF